MSFHYRKHAIARTIEEARESHPHLRGDIKKLEEHYNKALVKPMPHYIAAAVRLLTSSDVGEAAHRLSDDFRITGLGAENYIIDAVNAGPDLLKMREDMLHEKGVMRGRDRFFLGTRLIAAGSLYDRAWRAGDVTVRTILADAVQDAIPIKKRTLGHTAFNYVCASLLPAGNERDFAMNTLSLKQPRQHEALLETAIRYIKDVSQTYSLTVPANLPQSATARHLSVLAERSAAPVLPEHKRLGAALKATAEDISVTPPPATIEPASHVLRDQADINRLKSDLGKLRGREEISKRQADLYFWLHTEGKNGERTIADAAEIMKEPQNVVRIMVVQVSRKLDTLRGGESLDGQGHQPRAIGPQ